MERVSVIVPVYNCAPYIDRCMESLINQTYQELEILLMVGFCSDDSLERCLEWQKKDDRIIVVSRKDSSLGDARNYALKVATGKYIAYLDADDFYNPDYIEKMSAPLEANPSIEISCCGYDRFDETQILPGGLPRKSGVVDLDFKEYMKFVPAAAVWMKMFRRQWLLDNQIEMFDGCCEDQSLHFILAALVKKAYMIQQPLYHYNIGNENSLVHTPRSYLDYAAAVEYAIVYLARRDLYSRYRNDFLNRVCSIYEIFMQQTNYDKELAIVCRRFLEKYFPETVEEYEASKNRDMHIRSKVILYSAGADAEKFLKSRGGKGISYIVDKNPALHGREMHGLMIKPVEALYDEPEEVSVIVASSRYYYEIAGELRARQIQSIYKPEVFCDEYAMEELFKSDKQKRIILFITPEHANIGDHTIAEVEKNFFSRYLPEYHVVEITNTIHAEFRYYIHGLVEENDVIVITGGGFLGSLWLEGGEENVRSIMEEYRTQKIVVFPQSIFFEDTEEGEQEYKLSESIYNSCEDLTMFFRERTSYDRALKMLKNKKSCRLVPDIVLSAKKSDFAGVYKQRERNGVAVCLKDCKESVLDEKEKEKIFDIAKQAGKAILRTSMYAVNSITPEERQLSIKNKLNEIGGYELVITDTLHCMIFCAIMGTPCVAFNNISGKVKGVFQWICDCDYIEYVDEIDDLKAAIPKVLSASDKEYEFEYTPYFIELQKEIRG